MCKLWACGDDTVALRVGRASEDQAVPEVLSGDGVTGGRMNWPIWGIIEGLVILLAIVIPWWRGEEE